LKIYASIAKAATDENAKYFILLIYTNNTVTINETFTAYIEQIVYREYAT